MIFSEINSNQNWSNEKGAVTIKCASNTEEIHFTLNANYASYFEHILLQKLIYDPFIEENPK